MSKLNCAHITVQTKLCTLKKDIGQKDQRTKGQKEKWIKGQREKWTKRQMKKNTKGPKGKREKGQKEKKKKGQRDKKNTKMYKLNCGARGWTSMSTKGRLSER